MILYTADIPQLTLTSCNFPTCVYICCTDLKGNFIFLVPMNSSGMMKPKNKINFRMHYSDKMSFLSNVKIHGVMVSFVLVLYIESSQGIPGMEHSSFNKLATNCQNGLTTYFYQLL